MPRSPVSYGASCADELALLLGREAARVADLAQTAVLAVEAEDERADRVLGLARPPAEDDRVDRPDALDLDHPDALAGLVGRAGLLGDHALGVLQPVLGLLGGAHDRRELDRRSTSASSAARRSRYGQLEQDVVVAGEQVEGDEARGRLLGQHVDARLGRVDALAEQVELLPARLAVDHDLAVEDVAARRRTRSSGK